MNKKALFLFQRWYLYVAVAGIASFAVCGFISIKNNPKDSERINYFIAAANVDTTMLVNHTKEVVTATIREVRVNNIDSNANTALRYFSTVYKSSDFYIVPESWMNLVSSYSIGFDENTIKELIPNSVSSSFYEKEGTKYGIKLFDKESKSGCLSTIVSYNDEDYYLAFPKSSLHTGLLNNKSESSNAITITDKLLTL